MKKILYVTTVSRTINAFLIPHIKHLMSKGYYVEISSNVDLPISDELKDIKFNKIDFSRNPFSSNNLKAILQMQKLYKENNYDVVHVHTPIASFVTRFALRKKNVKIVYTAHGFHFYKGAPVINWILYYGAERISARWTNRIITINNEDFERAKNFKLRNKGEVLLMHGVGIDKEKYIIENFNKKMYRKSIGIKKDDFVILILAELNKNKNHIQIIKALELLDKNLRKNVKVVCAGEGALKEKLEKIIKEKNLNSNFRILGFRNDIKELLNMCDCIGLFSKREGLGKCILEGMVLNKPVIATKTRGTMTIYNDYKNMTLVDIDDFKQTKDAIEKTINLKLNNKSIYDTDKYLLSEILKNIELYNIF